MKPFYKKPLFLSFLIGILVAFISTVFQPKTPSLLIAHRGASQYAPENTLAAFEKAVDLGYDFIELDVRFSKDGKLVVVHDEDVSRTTNGTGYVSEQTAFELKQLDAGSWFSPQYAGETIPLLSEVLTLFGGKIGLLLDIKSPTDEMIVTLSNLLSESIENGIDPNTIKVQSFQPQAMQQLAHICPSISVGVLINKPITFFHLASYRHYASFISIQHHYLTKSFLFHANLFNYKIFTWTIKKESQLVLLERFPIDGVISNTERKEISPFIVLGDEK